MTGSRKIGDPAGKDLIQRTFLACFEGFARYRGEASFRTYLFSIAAEVGRDGEQLALQREREAEVGDVAARAGEAADDPADGADELLLGLGDGDVVEDAAGPGEVGGHADRAGLLHGAAALLGA